MSKWKCWFGFHELVILGFVKGDWSHGMFRCKRCGCGIQKREMSLFYKKISRDKMSDYMHTERGEQ
jgi:transcription elongation factor Elf1